MTSLPSSHAAHPPTGALRTNSVGYVANAAKRATVVGRPSGSFVLRREGDGTGAFRGSLIAAEGDGVADFSELTEVGRFCLDVAGVGRSVVFPIGPDAYVEPYRAAMLAFYAWRSGVDISFCYQGQHFFHAAGHLGGALLDLVGHPGAVKDVTGGWYDAGDYGKYIVNSAAAMGPLLQAWEDFRPALEVTRIEVPETGGDLPGYLAELRFQLDWMLKLQFEDGSVAHKLSPLDFPPFVVPARDALPYYLSDWGSAATAGFAATMAKASRTFERYDLPYASTLRSAALRAYAFLRNNPADHQPDPSRYVHQQYATDDGHLRIWAAAEIWETTGRVEALADFEARIAAFGHRVVANMDWASQSNFGVFTYLRSRQSGRSPAAVAALTRALLDTANTVVERANSRWGRGNDGYFWGSNGAVALVCTTLRVAHALTGDTRYLDAAAHQLAYLLGRNEYGRSQVTGVGIDPPRYPHDRRSSADGIDAPYPGYLVGGASREGNWEDVEDSYETNEVAINWQAALVYALAGFLPVPAPCSVARRE